MCQECQNVHVCQMCNILQKRQLWKILQNPHPPESSSPDSGYLSRPPRLLPLTLTFYCHQNITVAITNISMNTVTKVTWIWWWRWPPSPPGRPSPSSRRRCCSVAASPLSCPDTWDVSFSPITIPTCSVVQSLTEDEAYINWIQAGLLSHRNHIIHFQVPYSQDSPII